MMSSVANAAATLPASSMERAATEAGRVCDENKNTTAETVVIALTKR